MALVTNPIAPLIQKNVRKATVWEGNQRKLPASTKGKPVSGMRPAHSCRARSRLAERGLPSLSAGRQSIISAPLAAVPIPGQQIRPQRKVLSYVRAALLGIPQRLV